MPTRRSFIKQSSFGAMASIPAFSLANSLFNSSPGNDLKIFIFSKALQFLNYNDMCEAASEMGFDGIDLTVRPKGHVLPENVAVDLPIATKVMRDFRLLPLMISTNVQDAANPIDNKVLEVAGNLGYKIYRPGWSKYKEDKTIKESLNHFGEKLKGLASLNETFNISGSYHNHSGNYIGASIWDLAQVLKDIPPEQMGSQYDIMHGTIEGGKNWKTDFRLIKDHINSLVIKDFMWKKVDGKWKAVYVPMGEGMVDFEKYFSLLKKYNINVPVSIHVEYDLGGAEKGGIPTIDKNEVFKKIKRDLEFVRETWKNTIMDTNHSDEDTSETKESENSYLVNIDIVRKGTYKKYSYRLLNNHFEVIEHSIKTKSKIIFTKRLSPNEAMEFGQYISSFPLNMLQEEYVNRGIKGEYHLEYDISIGKKQKSIYVYFEKQKDLVELFNRLSEFIPADLRFSYYR